MNFLSKICALLLIAWSSQLIAQSEITSIEFEGLKVTNTKVVINELNVSVGSIVNINTLDSVLSLECSQLYNLRLFHWVKSRYKVNEKKNTVDVVFTFQERWYLWPIPIFSLADRNFNSWLQKGNLKRLDYGLHIVHYNFRGKNEHLKSNIQEGYNKKYEVFYTIPYINKNQNLGIEVATSYSRSHYVDFNVEDNKLLTKEFNFYPLQKYYLRGSIFYRKSVLNQIYFRSEFKSLSISDSLTNLNANYIGVSGNVKFVTFQLEYLLNKRNNFSYPEKGYFVSADITQRVGLENVNLRLLQSSLNVAKGELV